MTKNGKPLTTGDIASYCGVTRTGVVRWIQENKIKAFRTPGGHYRVQKDDFRNFLANFDMPIDPSIFAEDS